MFKKIVNLVILVPYIFELKNMEGCVKLVDVGVPKGA